MIFYKCNEILHLSRLVFVIWCGTDGRCGEQNKRLSHCKYV